MRRPGINYAAFTGTGGRAANEDAVLALEKEGRYCFVVADGLGGHGLGDVASKHLTTVFSDEFERFEYSRRFLHQAFDRTQAEISAMQAQKGLKNQMKTTGAALCISNNKCLWGHIGDTRLYYFKRGRWQRGFRFVLRTIDHSVPQMLALSGEITESEIAAHPDRNRLLRVIGDTWEYPQYKIYYKEIPLRRHTAFLLCTDGVWELLPHPPAPAPGADAQTWLSSIIEEVERAGEGTGEMDNYSAIAVVVT